ncbi:unnamed protein product [Lampetra fluviatilis]
MSSLGNYEMPRHITSHLSHSKAGQPAPSPTYEAQITAAAAADSVAPLAIAPPTDRPANWPASSRPLF